ncbi:hypothetical protein BpHYR1_050994, partial [Brachionus plicatilis]
IYLVFFFKSISIIAEIFECRILHSTWQYKPPKIKIQLNKSRMYDKIIDIIIRLNTYYILVFNKPNLNKT